VDIHTFLIIIHIVGTVLGVGGATFAEILYIRASRDGKIDEEESATLRVTYTVLRIGLVLAVVSGFGFLLLYRFEGLEERLLSPKLWAKMSIILILLFNAILLSARKIPMWIGSPVSLASWYGALIIGSFGRMPYTYFQIMLVYFVAVIIIGFIIHKIRKRFIKVLQ
jgi:hypothetical protein